MAAIDLLDVPRQHEKLGQLIGRAPVMHKVFKQIKKAAAVDISILLQGETGAGKDLAAHTIHQLSSRHDGPYIPVNLGAFPSEIIASELFGHEKGAFTGAVAQRKGKFEQARDGTIFLDEIEAIDEKVQVSLLRLLEEQRFYRLGGKRCIVTNARIMAASNQDLRESVKQGTFRQDLFYRLDVFPINMPPLRERKEDIPLFANSFILRFNRLLKKQITKLDPECLRIFEAYEWPGNIRELKNMLHRAVLLCDGEELRPDHLPARLCETPATRSVLNIPCGASLDDIERAVILQTLNQVNNNRTEAAKMLGISRRALYNRLRKHRLE